MTKGKEYWKEYDELKQQYDKEANLPIHIRALRETGFFMLQLTLALIVCMLLFAPVKPSKFSEVPSYLVNVCKSIPAFFQNIANCFSPDAVCRQNTPACLTLSSAFYIALALMTKDRIACALAAPIILFDYSLVAFATKEFHRTIVFAAVALVIPISFKIDIFPVNSPDFAVWLGASVFLIAASGFGSFVSIMPIAFLVMGGIRCLMWVNPRMVSAPMQRVNAGLIWGAQYLAVIAAAGIAGAIAVKTGAFERHKLFSIRSRAQKMFEPSAGDNLIMFLVLAFLALMVPDSVEDGRVYVMLIGAVLALQVSAFTSAKATVTTDEVVEQKFCEVKEILFLTFCLRVCSIQFRWFSVSFLVVAAVFAVVGYLNLI